MESRLDSSYQFQPDSIRNRPLHWGKALERETVTLNYTHTSEESHIYREQEDRLTGVLIDQSEYDRKPKWLLNTHRSLTMLTMSLNLLGLDSDFTLKANKLKIILLKSDFYLDWFQKPTVPLHDKLPPNPTTYTLDNSDLLLQ